jgi:hypothetical protein
MPPKRSRKNNKFYAVAVGRRPGIYESWDECKEQVRLRMFIDVEESTTIVNQTMFNANNLSIDSKIQSRQVQEL